MNRNREPGIRRWPMAKPAIVAMTTDDGHDAEHDEHARREQGAHVGLVEGLQEVAPLRVGRPGEARRDGVRMGGAPS